MHEHGARPVEPVRAVHQDHPPRLVSPFLADARSARNLLASYTNRETARASIERGLPTTIFSCRATAFQTPPGRVARRVGQVEHQLDFSAARRLRARAAARPPGVVPSVRRHARRPPVVQWRLAGHERIRHERVGRAALPSPWEGSREVCLDAHRAPPANLRGSPHPARRPTARRETITARDEGARREI